MKSNESPFVGQWQCPTCGRTFGRHFTQCGYCPFAEPGHTEVPPVVAQVRPAALPVGKPARGVTGRVWAVLDGLGAGATIARLLAVTSAEGINESTARTQFSKWKKMSRST